MEEIQWSLEVKNSIDVFIKQEINRVKPTFSLNTNTTSVKINEIVFYEILQCIVTQIFFNHFSRVGNSFLLEDENEYLDYYVFTDKLKEFISNNFKWDIEFDNRIKSSIITFNNIQKVMICLHCKEFHLEGIKICNFCNNKSFQETDYKNKKFIKKLGD